MPPDSVPASAAASRRRASPVRAVLDLLAPPRCLACRVRADPPWCTACAAEVRSLDGGCPRCAAPRQAGHPCWPPDAAVTTTRAAFDYGGPVAAAVVTAKVGGAHAGWRPLARLLAERVAAEPPDVDVVTWVTTAPRRRRRRGLDHAEVLAGAVATAIGVPLLGTLRATVTGHRDRYRARLALPGSNVLLVDDVLTTGATAGSAAAALLVAGAGTVHLAVLARAGPHRLVAA